MGRVRAALVAGAFGLAALPVVFGPVEAQAFAAGAWVATGSVSPDMTQDPLTVRARSYSLSGTWAFAGLRSGVCSITFSGSGSEYILLGSGTGSLTCNGSGVTGPVAASCAVSWSRLLHQAVLNGACSGTFSGGVVGAMQWMYPTPNSVLVTGVLEFDTAPPPTTTSTTSPGTWHSDSCTSGTVIDGSTAGVYHKIKVHQVDAATTWVCVRVASGSTSKGGKVVVTRNLPTPPPPPALPRTDANSAACTATTPNAAPGPHPLAVGQIGDPGGTPDVAYLLDTYSGNSEAWVCVKAGTAAAHRVVIPTGLPGGPGGGTPSVTFHPDPGT